MSTNLDNPPITLVHREPGTATHRTPGTPDPLAARKAWRSEHRSHRVAAQAEDDAQRFALCSDCRAPYHGENCA